MGGVLQWGRRAWGGVILGLITVQKLCIKLQLSVQKSVDSVIFFLSRHR